MHLLLHRLAAKVSRVILYCLWLESFDALSIGVSLINVTVVLHVDDFFQYKHRQDNADWDVSYHTTTLVCFKATAHLSNKIMWGNNNKKKNFKIYISKKKKRNSAILCGQHSRRTTAPRVPVLWKAASSCQLVLFTGCCLQKALLLKEERETNWNVQQFKCAWKTICSVVLVGEEGSANWTWKNYT